MPDVFELMSSTPDRGFAHYVSAGLYPGTAVRLVVGLYLEVDPSGLGWSCFIAASFYDQNNRVLWHKQICLVQRHDFSDRDWSTIHGFDLGPPPPREPVIRKSQHLTMIHMTRLRYGDK